MEIDLQPLDLAETEQYLFETVTYSYTQFPGQLQFEVDHLVNAIYGATLSVGGSLESVGTKIQKELDQFNTNRLLELFGSVFGTAKLQVIQGDSVGWHVVLEANGISPAKAHKLPEFIRRELYTKYISGFRAYLGINRNTSA